VVVDKKARTFLKMSKTWQFRKPALYRAFPGKKHEIARAFYVKYDQNYGLWSPNGLETKFNQSPDSESNVSKSYLNKNISSWKIYFKP
jgi:hypothetical protein